MFKYVEIFVKAIITAAGITFVAGLCMTVRILITYNETLQSIEKRIARIENYIILNKNE